MTITIEVSPGELIDKITILEIKAERIADPARQQQVAHELGVLCAARDRSVPASAALAAATRALKEVNAALWTIEDDIRDCERARSFDTRFIELARSVYRQNDRRAALKSDINRLLASTIVEVKSYAPY